MDEPVYRTVVVSAVNLRKGGTLTILRQCLEHLSGLATSQGLQVTALVHDRTLCDYPGINYVEIPWATRSWLHRLWCEYVTMHRISKNLAESNGSPVDLWLSLHDTTPRVLAKCQEVYCHTSFPFLTLIPRDLVMDPKIPLFALFTRWAYRINIHRNTSIIVQQHWFADAMSKMLHVPITKFRVIPPTQPTTSTRADGGPLLGATLCGAEVNPENVANADEGSLLSATLCGASQEGSFGSVTFLYVSTPDCHKNFETLLEASRMLENEGCKFKVKITVAGDENRYAKWLKKHWGDVKSVEFLGQVKREDITELYRSADVFVFPSRIETWGLPISEYAEAKPEGKMLLSDLPYAHETAAGARDVAYFSPRDAKQLKELMYESIAAR